MIVLAGHCQGSAATPRTWLSSSGVMCGGRIFYAWYLWHWPVLLVGDGIVAGRARENDQIRVEAGDFRQDRVTPFLAFVSSLDLTDLICGPVKDGILVMRESHHLTATYAAMLAATFEQLLMETQQSKSDPR